MSDHTIGEGFRETGFHLERGLFDPETTRALETDFDLIVEQLHASGEQVNARWESADGQPTDEVVHTHNVQNFSSVWLDALRDKRYLDVAEAILGPDIVLHHSKLFQKPPQHGAAFPMHQDWRYFPTARDSMIAAIIHLTPATVDMGCVHVVPGSHRLGRLDSTSGRPLWDDADGYASFAEQYPLEQAVPIEAEPGDVLFFSYFTVHGSGPNRSQATRKTVLVQMFSGADELDPESEHPVSGLVLRGRNRTATRRSAGKVNRQLG